MMARMGAVAAGLCLTAILSGAAVAHAESANGAAGKTPGQSVAAAAKTKSQRTTPRSVVLWYQKRLDRMAVQQRAVEMRKSMMQSAGSRPAPFEMPAQPAQ